MDWQPPSGIGDEQTPQDAARSSSDPNSDPNFINARSQTLYAHPGMISPSNSNDVFGALDAIPVRSRRPRNAISAAGETSPHTNDFYHVNTSFTATEQASTQTSSFPTVSSSTRSATLDFSQSCTTMMSESATSLPKSYSPAPLANQDDTAMEHQGPSFGSFASHLSYEEDPCSNRSGTSTACTSFSAVNNDTNNIDKLDESMHPPSALVLQFNKIWPRFRPPGLRQAPLGIQWEFARLALECDVKPEDLDDCNLEYDDTVLWKDQARFGQATSTVSREELPTPMQRLGMENSPGRLSNRKQFSLEPLKTEVSHRLSRRFGADRFLEVSILPATASGTAKIDREVFERALDDWVEKKHHRFLGRHWAPFFVRDEKKSVKTSKAPGSTVEPVYGHRIYFFARDGDHFRNLDVGETLAPAKEAFTPQCRTKMSVGDFLAWSIDPSNNAHQPILKQWSRITLSLTHTQPTVVLENDPKHIRHRTEDILGGVADDRERHVMNDGIGRMSKSLGAKIADCLGLDPPPCGYQGRFGSAKGVWIIDNNNDGCDDIDWIETYPSQRKWECNFEDPLHRTFEVKDWPKMATPSSLNSQLISILIEQANNKEEMRVALADALKRNLWADLEALKLQMECPLSLLQEQHKGGSYGGSRDENGCILFLGGLPDATKDKIQFLIGAGFEPRKNKLLADLVCESQNAKMEKLTAKMNIEVPCSTTLLMVADFSSTLEPGEVHVSFSSEFRVEGYSDTLLDDIDVLVARNPAHLPSDIQKFRAVFKRNLRHLKNTVVFSTKGVRSDADTLSGGDFDGDKAWVCWDQRLVSNFHSTALPSASIFNGDEYYDVNKTTFSELLSVSPDMDTAYDKFLHQSMKFNLKPSMLGSCTAFKERFCYWANSISSPEAKALSMLLSKQVDGGKQGIIFTEKHWLQFRERYHLPRHLPLPLYKDEGAKPQPSGHQNLHIIDYLKFEVSGRAIERCKTELQQHTNALQPQHYDPDLTALYTSFDVEAYKPGNDHYKAILRQLRADIDTLADEWAKQADYATMVLGIHKRWQAISPDVSCPRSQALADSLLEEWCTNRDTTAWALLKASTTFYLYGSRRPKFAWQIAGRQLATIKMKMTHHGNHTAAVVVQPEIWGVMKPDKKRILAITSQNTEEPNVERRFIDDEFLDYDLDSDDMTIDE